MPSASIIHTACFAVGALIGGGTVAYASMSRKPQLQVPAAPVAGTTSLPVTIPKASAPMMQVDHGGQLDLAASPAAGVILKYGNPGPISDFFIRKAYIAAYDRRMRHPAWTAEHLTLSSLGKSVLASGSLDESEKGDRGRSVFTEDAAVPTPFRARLQDYFKSGYDRGHMVPAADAKMSQEAMNETFKLTNIAPQVGDGFNRHYWAGVENWCRKLTSDFQDVYVFTVPLYLPRLDADGKYRVTYEVIGSPPNVSVPTHFAKVVLTSRPSSPKTPDVLEVAAGAFVLPNAVIPDSTPFETFSVPVDAVERAAGLTLFSDAIKTSARHLCKTTKCEVVVRRFDDAQKMAKGPPKRRAISGPV